MSSSIVTRTEQLPTHLIRIDKNVGKNVLDFSSLGKDAPLVKSLIYYFCHTYQHNLFGYRKLNPYEFAKQFGFTVGHLRKRHPDPAQLRGMSQEEVAAVYQLQEERPEMRVWDSNLENALWILKSTKINYRYGGKTFSASGEQAYYAEVKDIQFLNELSAIFHKNDRGGRERITYHYELDRSFVENLTNYYFKANAHSISVLRKPALDDLYVYLKNLRASLKGETKATPAFSLLCELAHIDNKSAKHAKHKLTKDLEKISRETDLPFSLEWVKEHQGVRYCYKPVLWFAPSPAEDPEAERNNIFYQKLVHELMSMYRKKYNAYPAYVNSEEKFLSWCRKSTVDEEEKVLAFQTAYFDTWRTAINSSHHSIKRYRQQLALVNTIPDLYRIQWRYFV